VNKKKVKSNPFATKSKVKKLEDIKIENGGIISSASNNTQTNLSHMNNHIVSNNLSNVNPNNIPIENETNSNYQNQITKSLDAINTNQITSVQKDNIT